MGRLARITILFALGCLLAIGTPGGTQVPPGPGPGPGWLLRDAEDLESTRFVLTTLASQGLVADPNRTFVRAQMQLGPFKVYKGQAISSQPTRSSPGAIAITTFYFVHRQGTPCALPPDMLAISTTTIVGATAPSPAIDPKALEFFVEVLRQLADYPQPGPLSTLGRWFDSSNQIEFLGCKVRQSGGGYSCRLQFLDSSQSPPVAQVREISAQLTATGFYQWTVR